MNEKKPSKNKSNKDFREKQTKIQLIQPERERYLFAVEWWAGGCPVFLCFRLIYLSFRIHNRENTYNNIFKKRKTLKVSRKTKIKQKNTCLQCVYIYIYSISKPEHDRYLFAVGSRAGYPVLLFLFEGFSRVKGYTRIHVTC